MATIQKQIKFKQKKLYYGIYERLNALEQYFVGFEMNYKIEQAVGVSVLP